MNNIRANYHTHIQRCLHATGDAVDYAKEAVQKGLSILGISDHMPFPDDRFGLVMLYADVEDYLQEVTAVKEQFQGQLKVLCGFEGDYFAKDWKYYESLLQKENCDYLILGQHFFETDGSELGYTFEIKDTSFYETLSEQMVAGMRTGYFQYLAHPDLMFFNVHDWDIHCERALDTLIDGAIKYDFAFEYNANGLRRGLKEYPDGVRYPYPHHQLWERVKNTNIKVFVGSDCHNPEKLWDESVVKAYHDLAQYGIIPQTHLNF